MRARKCIRAGQLSQKVTRSPSCVIAAHSLVRLAYLAVTQTFATPRLLPMTDREKDAEILALRHQLSIPQRQLDGKRPASKPRG
ncbi:hypothetical protein ACFRU3_14425 [Streptomyces sp. NPDC056910]|uniref:hypothetical protein n=1 Tax=Streptomyces sp. NPDC056910 TaxID=3345964 RepID=UPI00368D7A9A